MFSMHLQCSLFLICCTPITFNLSRTAFERVSGSLSQKVDTLASDLKGIPSDGIANNANTSNLSSTPPSQSENYICDLLAKAKPLEPLNQEDFKNLKYWEPAPYRLLRKVGKKVQDDVDEVWLICCQS